MDYLFKLIKVALSKGELSFYQLKRMLAENKVFVDKQVLLTRLRQTDGKDTIQAEWN